MAHDIPMTQWEDAASKPRMKGVNSFYKQARIALQRYGKIDKPTDEQMRELAAMVAKHHNENPTQPVPWGGLAQMYLKG